MEMTKNIKNCQEDLSKITGQMPVLTKFKKSISTLKQEKIAIQV